MMEHQVLRAMLVIAPAGYLIAVFMYLAYKCNEAEDGDGSTSRQKFELKYYHFLPICRYYLVVKDKEADDVEGLLRVNSLSSFTLGICQIIGLAFAIGVFGQEIDIFIRINIGAQVFNWLITLAYFMTPMAARMMAAVKIDALVYNSKERQKSLFLEYLELTMNGVEYEEKDSVYYGKLEKFEGKIDSEILAFANVKNPGVIRQYKMTDKFEALIRLHQRANGRFASIG